jgi:hypothetical protein
VKTRAVLVRRNGTAGRAALLATVTVVAAGALSAVAEPIAGGALAPVVGFGWPVAVALSAAWLGYWRAWRDDVVVDVGSGSLDIDGTTRRGAGTLRRGDATVLDDGHVRVDLRGWYRPRVRLVLKDIAVARELLAGLGLDRRTGTSQFRVRRLRPYENLLLLLLLFLSVPVVIALSIASGTLGLMGLFAAVLVPFLIRVQARVELTVGADGLELRTSLGRTFLPHSRIGNVTRIWPEGYERGSRHEGEVVSWGFELALDDGTKHRIDTRPERFAAGVWKTDPVFASAFAAWSEAQASGGTAAPHASALLARGGRSTREWITSLRELATDGAGGYRVPALDEHALFAILGDAAAPRELRAGAAVAIGVREEHASRLRIAADDVADPIVRRVAVASAEGGDADSAALLEAELDEVLRASEEGRTTSRR